MGKTKGLHKGDKIAVEPVRDIDHIRTIAQYLSGKPRDLLLWTLGINNGLRAFGPGKAQGPPGGKPETG